MAGFFWGHQTQTAGTIIKDLAPPVSNRKVRLTGISYTSGATVHDLVIMRAINQVQLTAASAQSDTTLDLDIATFGADTLASGDWVIVEHFDGTYGAYVATGLAALVLTITGGLTKAANAGAAVFIMGAPGDTTFHSTFKSVASVRQDFSGIYVESGYDTGTYSRDGLGDPIMFYSANGSNAGTLNWGTGPYAA